jgi:DNA-binding GntR family transcriptional regulator
MSSPLDSRSDHQASGRSPLSTAPGDHKLLSRAVADWLAARIIGGQLAPGDRLTEIGLAGEAGVSRSPVREALRLLAREGLVEIAPRLGAQVAQVAPGDARDLYACRLLIEPSCVQTAVEAMPPAGVRALEHRHAAMAAAADADDGRRFLTENNLYFRELTAHCPNPLLHELVELTWTKALRYWSILARRPDYGHRSLERLAPLHAAVRARDASSAADADRRILERALEEILATFDPGEG